VLSAAVTSGILDAPQLRNNPFGLGKVVTRIIDGASCAVDDKGEPITESVRLATFIN